QDIQPAELAHRRRDHLVRLLAIRMVRTVSPARASSRSAATTVAPSAPYFSAAARPIPEPAPVTMATLRTKRIPHPRARNVRPPAATSKWAGSMRPFVALSGPQQDAPPKRRGRSSAGSIGSETGIGNHLAGL